MNKKIIALVSLLILLATPLAGCSNQTEEETLVIYSGRKEQFVMPLIEKFEQDTGIKVQLLSGNAIEYAHRIMEEQRNPQADIFLANDAGVMEYLRLQGALEPNNSKELTNIPANFRAEDGSWVGLSARSRVLMYNKDLITETEMPQSILDLTDPKYKGQFAITRAGNESMISHISALRAELGDEATTELLKGILANKPIITSGHTDIRKAVGSGEVAFGLVNNYYFHLQLEEETHNNVGVIYPDQGEQQMGTFVNVAGVAIVKDAKNMDNAKAFVDFLLQPEQQELFAYNSKETPLVANVPTLDYAKKIDEYKHMSMPLSNLGTVWEDTVDLMERAGFSE